MKNVLFGTQGRGGGNLFSLIFSSRARAYSKFLRPPYKLQRRFAGRLVSPSLLFPGLFNRVDTALKPELV